MVTQDERQSEAWRVAEADAEALRIRSYEDAARAVAAAVRRRPPTTQPPSVSHAQSCTHTHVTFKTVSPTFSSVLFVTEHPPPQVAAAGAANQLAREEAAAARRRALADLVGLGQPSAV